MLVLAMSGCSTPANEPASTAAPLNTPSWAQGPPDSGLVAQRMADCVTAAGFDVSLSGSSYTFTGPPEQTDAFLAAADDGYIELGYADTVAPELTDEVIARAHAREIESHACLTAPGFEIQAVPSLPAYSDLLLGDRQYSTWSSLPPMGESELADVARSCPDPLQYFWQD